MDGSVLREGSTMAIELTNETRRMAFLRGTIEQAGAVVLTFMAIIRKIPAR